MVRSELVNGENQERFGNSALSFTEVVGIELDAKSVDGRLLMETAAREKDIKQAKALGIKMDMTTCPYPGIRNGLPMHASAMQAMNASWDDIIRGLGWINRLHFRNQIHKNVTLQDAQTLTNLCLYAPFFVAKRVDNPIPTHAFPVDMAAICKISRGISATVGTISSSGLPIAMTPENIMQFAESSGELVRDDVGCAAPPRKMLEALQALLVPGFASGESAFSTYIPSTKPFIEYAGVVGRFHDALQELNTTSYDIYDTIESTHKLDIKRKEVSKYRALVSRFHQRAIATHREGNKHLGRPRPTTPPEYDEVASLLSVQIENLNESLY